MDKLHDSFDWACSYLNHNASSILFVHCAGKSTTHETRQAKATLLFILHRIASRLLSQLEDQAKDVELQMEDVVLIKCFIGPSSWSQ